MSVDRIEYLDSSAIVKMVLEEPESESLKKYLDSEMCLVSSTLAWTESHRAVLPYGLGAVRKVREVLGVFDLIEISASILMTAAVLQPASLRSLDAIHLATAATLGDSLSRFIAYDKRLLRSAVAQGWDTHSPGLR